MRFPHIDFVYDYLAEEFPDLESEDAEGFDLHAHRFKVTGDYRDYMLKIFLDYAADTTGDSLSNLLRDENIAAHMRNPEFRYVMISNDGIAPAKNSTRDAVSNYSLHWPLLAESRRPRDSEYNDGI